MEVEAHRWLESEKERGRYLLEDVRLVEQWNQALTLIWFEDGRKQGGDNFEEDEEAALRELDGTLPWPSKRKRR